jgi:hypothetical protein
LPLTSRQVLASAIIITACCVCGCVCVLWGAGEKAAQGTSRQVLASAMIMTAWWVWVGGLTSKHTSRCLSILSCRQAFASSTAARFSCPGCSSSRCSRRSNSVSPSAVLPAVRAHTWERSEAGRTSLSAEGSAVGFAWVQTASARQQCCLQESEVQEKGHAGRSQKTKREVWQKEGRLLFAGMSLAAAAAQHTRTCESAQARHRLCRQPPQLACIWFDHLGSCCDLPVCYQHHLKHTAQRR